MKKILITLVLAVATTLTMSSQSKKVTQTEKGKFLIDLKTQIGNLGGGITNTGFSFVKTGGVTAWSAGLDGGYFIANNFALKAGFTYSDSDSSTSTFTYKLGAKYYFNGNIPFEVDLSGYSQEFLGVKPIFLGINGGYSFFLGDNLSIEPAIKYSIPINDTKNIFNNGLSLNVGFSIYL
jgi:hypothetical protein